MIQEMFPGRITPLAAASFVGLDQPVQHDRAVFLGGSTSDYIGRRNTYT